MNRIAIAGNRNIESESILETLKHEGHLFTAEEIHSHGDMVAAVMADMEIGMVIFIKDLSSPLPSSLIRATKEARPDIRILAISGSDTVSELTAAMDTGINGYLNTNISKDELCFAVRHIFAGHKYVASSLYKTLFAIPGRPLHEEGHDFPGLSEREKQVLQLIMEGYNNQEIAYQLFTTKNTVMKYRKGLLERTGQRNLAGLLQYAIRKGIIC